jgi:hypothetical protein
MAARGRPLKYKTVEELEKAIDAYFESCKAPLLDKDGRAVLDDNGRPIMTASKPVTVTGLALALGFAGRNALLDYQSRRDFTQAVARAKTRCEEYAESCLYGRSGANGARFSLQNNFGWRERQEIDQTLSSKDGKPLVVSDLSDGEIEKKLAALGFKKAVDDPVRD